jgi:hypothetical protein
MKKLYLILILSVFALIHIDAKHPSKGAEKKEDKRDDKKEEPWLNVEIIPTEREIIRNYIVQWQEKEGKGKEQKVRSLPPGLAKKVARGGELPPGWQKKIARGEVVSDSIFKEMRRLPEEIILKLPKQPKGTVLMAVDGKVVRLAEATKTILDVFALD